MTVARDHPIEKAQGKKADQHQIERELAVQRRWQFAVHVLRFAVAVQSDVRRLRLATSHHHVVQSFLLNGEVERHARLFLSTPHPRIASPLDRKGNAGVLALHSLGNQKRLLLLAQLLLPITHKGSNYRNGVSITAERFLAVVVVAHGIEHRFRHNHSLLVRRRERSNIDHAACGSRRIVLFDVQLELDERRSATVHSNSLIPLLSSGKVLVVHVVTLVHEGGIVQEESVELRNCCRCQHQYRAQHLCHHLE